MRIANDDVAQFLTKLAPYVDSEGARNLNRISRELGIPYQTLRFRMLRLKDQGISVSPQFSTGRIGLDRYRVSFHVSSDMTDVMPFFGGLHQSAGLHYFARSLVSQEFDCEFMIPRNTKGELMTLLKALEEMNFIEHIVVRRLLWKEILMMKTKNYDYEHGQWDVDYTRLSGDPSIRVPIEEDDEVKYDHTDLLIIKSLQIDPWLKVVDLAGKIGISEGDVSYHLNRHVLDRKLISNFRFKWVGTKDAWAKHTIMPLTVVFKSLSEESARHAMSILTGAPFTWNHMRAEDGTYMSELVIPVSQIPETMKHLSDNLRPMGLKPEILYPDWATMMNYTIPYHMHTDAEGWKFSAEASLGHVLAMIRTFQKE